jgi:acetylornithine deacetylase
MSTYPDRCLVKIERRTVPGETPNQTLAEIRAACDRVRVRRSDFRADVSIVFSQEPSDVSPDAPIVRAVDKALRSCGHTVRIEGASYWTDAALLNAAGIPTVCFGPGDIGMAHGAEEWVETAEVERATHVLTELISQWGR